MATISIRANNGTVLASRDIPDTAIPALRLKYAGATNAETADNILAAIFQMLKDAALQKKLEDRHNADFQTVVAGQATERTNFSATVWP